MRLSTRGRYALRMMLDIARSGTDGKPVSLASVASRTDISRGYLEQLASLLRNARLLRAASGRYGGYRLAKQPTEITIGEIIETAVGPICIVECVEELESCDKINNCEARVVYSLINNRIADVLNDFTLANLLESNWISKYQDKVLMKESTP